MFLRSDDEVDGNPMVSKFDEDVDLDDYQVDERTTSKPSRQLDGPDDTSEPSVGALWSPRVLLAAPIYLYVVVAKINSFNVVFNFIVYIR